MNSNNENNVDRLPLWKACVEEMIAAGVKYGDVFASSFFSARLKCSQDSMEFSLGISEIRRALEREGMYLSGRGQNGEQFVVLPPAKNADVMMDYGRRAADALRRGVILGTNTRLDLLEPGERERHEKMLEKMAIKAALIMRSSSVVKALSSTARKRLKITA